MPKFNFSKQTKQQIKHQTPEFYVYATSLMVARFGHVETNNRIKAETHPRVEMC